jgi:hypothetical protein
MQQIADWLEKLNLGQYAQRFAENDIDVSVLPHLTDADLEKIGVSLGHRRKMLAAIAELPGASPSKHETVRGPEPKIQDTAERRQVTVMFSDLVGSTALSAPPEPIRSPTTTRPVAMPTRVCRVAWVSMPLRSCAPTSDRQPRAPNPAPHVAPLARRRLRGLAGNRNAPIKHLISCGKELSNYATKPPKRPTVCSAAAQFRQKPLLGKAQPPFSFNALEILDGRRPRNTMILPSPHSAACCGAEAATFGAFSFCVRRRIGLGLSIDRQGQRFDPVGRPKRSTDWAQRRITDISGRR